MTKLHKTNYSVTRYYDLQTILIQTSRFYAIYHQMMNKNCFAYNSCENLVCCCFFLYSFVVVNLVIILSLSCMYLCVFATTRVVMVNKDKHLGHFAAAKM